jgi:hypothetical protein
MNTINTDVWLTIETAPKDGTPILVYDNSYSHPIVSMWKSEYNNTGWLSPHEGYYEEEVSGDHCALKFNPTHWMPLPKTPILAE